jgi:AbrB family looped-hinge helix DNA binding protein
VGTLIKVGKYSVVGMVEVTKVDSKGRVLIPKNMRERSELFEGTLVKIEADDGKIIIEPMESIADKYYGVFKADEVPEDLDEFLPEVQAKLWKERYT